jgi:hypothetical protein
MASGRSHAQAANKPAATTRPMPVQRLMLVPAALSMSCREVKAMPSTPSTTP